MGNLLLFSPPQLTGGFFSRPDRLMSEPIVEVRNLTKQFGAITALNDMSVAFFPSEVHGIIGENGAGKSTLVKILTGYHTSYVGEIRVRGYPVKFHTPRDSQQQGIGCVYQERNLVPELTVAENIFLGRLPSKTIGLVNWKQLCVQAQEQLNALGLDLDVMQKVSSYPQGLRQMAEIARILFSGAEVVILDEPTGALSITERDSLFSLIARLKGQGKTIIYISHFLEEVLQLSDRITVFRNGEKVTSVQPGDVDSETLVRLMSGDSAPLSPNIEQTIKHKQSEMTDIALEGRRLSVRGHLRDVSFKLYRGEVLGLYGNVGSGALALSEAIVGLRKFEAGTLLLNGQVIRCSSPAAASQQGIAFIPEERRDVLWGNQSVAHNITNGHLAKISRFWVRHSKEIDLAKVIIDRMDIVPPDPTAPVQNLSGGNQQKVVVGRWLLELPNVLMVCEPTNGMDVGAKRAMIQKIWEIKQQGVAMMIISTDPEVILDSCNRAIVFRRGRITAELSSEAMSKEMLVVNG